MSSFSQDPMPAWQIALIFFLMVVLPIIIMVIIAILDPGQVPSHEEIKGGSLHF